MPLRFPSILGWLSLIWSAAFWIALVFIPVVTLFAESRSADVPLLDPVILLIARITFLQAALSALISAAMGLLLGLWVGDIFSRRGSRVIRLLLLLPYGVPTVVAGLAWVKLLGVSGWGWAYSMKAVVIAHVFFNVPYVALIVAEARALVPRAQLESARLLGASSWQTFRAVTWPVIWRSLASASAQVLALCAMSFGLVMILGGGPPVETLETALYSRIRFGELDVGGAVACAVWQLLIVMTPWLVVLVLGDLPRRRLGGRRVYSEGGRVWICALVCAVFMLPYLIAFTAVHRLFDMTTWSELREPLALSLLIAVASGLGAVLTALAAIGASLFTRSSRFLPLLFALPSGLSVLVLGLGAWIAYSQWIDPFEGSLTAIIALQIAIFFPVAFRMFWPQAQMTRVDLLEAATTLGASPLKAFVDLEWPRWRKIGLASWAMGSAAALGEIASVSFFYSEELIPMPLLISRWMGQYRFEQAELASALLLLLSCGLVAMISILNMTEVTDASTRANR